MAERITDEMIEYVSALAQLELSGKEREAAKQDMGRMLGYIELLNEADTAEAEPTVQIFPIRNVFREDIVVNGDGREETLRNAPEKRDGLFAVPRTFG